jgi:hypothetical protein
MHAGVSDNGYNGSAFCCTQVFLKMVTMVTMVTMGGDLQPGCLADRLLTGLGQPQINPQAQKEEEKVYCSAEKGNQVFLTEACCGLRQFTNTHREQSPHIFPLFSHSTARRCL